MRFTSLRVQQFRNYPFLELAPSEGVTVLYGPNGSGKTNLLEAMHLLSLGRSHRTSVDREMIAAGESVALVHGETQRIDGRHDVEVRLYPLEKPQKRVLLYGKPAQRISDMMGHATVVMFSPEDIRIIRDGPAARRRFVDMQLSQIRPSYLKALKQYLSVLESRNALLKRDKLEGVEDFGAQLDAWDEQLASAAVAIVNTRRWFLGELSENAAREYAAIADNPEETFLLQYASSLATTETPYQNMLEGLRRSRNEDRKRMYTTFGPHRDDMSMLLYGKELRAYGSQGQLRTAVLSMKLGEIKLIEREMGEAPTLLLDDVFSELDARRRNALLRSTEGVQTLITCTDKLDAAGAHADCFLQVSQEADGSARVKREM
ncbi:MAG: DNA replication/repair protein RecF [Eubacteriales bacterium]|nr:DNA replication/repair protein RecF [Eubacteriales bacterium]